MKEKILNWLINGKVGASSKTMACCAIDQNHDCSHPYDPGDFNRCLLLLNEIPEIRNHFDKISKISKTWNSLIKNWNKIEKSFLEEAGFNWSKGYSAPKTYDLMESILKL